jgi:hypothetical protein
MGSTAPVTAEATGSALGTGAELLAIALGAGRAGGLDDTALPSKTIQIAGANAGRRTIIAFLGADNSCQSPFFFGGSTAAGLEAPSGVAVDDVVEDGRAGGAAPTSGVTAPPSDEPL